MKVQVYFLLIFLTIFMVNILFYCSSNDTGTVGNQPRPTVSTNPSSSTTTDYTNPVPTFSSFAGFVSTTSVPEDGQANYFGLGSRIEGGIELMGTKYFDNSLCVGEELDIPNLLLVQNSIVRVKIVTPSTPTPCDKDGYLFFHGVIDGLEKGMRYTVELYVNDAIQYAQGDLFP